MGSSFDNDPSLQPASGANVESLSFFTAAANAAAAPVTGGDRAHAKAAVAEGSARVSRAGFGVAPKRTFLDLITIRIVRPYKKVREREDALANTRDACATRKSQPVVFSRLTRKSLRRSRSQPLLRQ